MKRLLKWALCALTGHFARRTPMIVTVPQLQWQTRLACACGQTNILLPGIVRQDGRPL